MRLYFAGVEVTATWRKNLQQLQITRNRSHQYVGYVIVAFHHIAMLDRKFKKLSFKHSGTISHNLLFILKLNI